MKQETIPIQMETDFEYDIKEYLFYSLHRLDLAFHYKISL